MLSGFQGKDLGRRKRGFHDDDDEGIGDRPHLKGARGRVSQHVGAGRK